MFEIGVDFVLELVARTSRTGRQWIATLDHEIWNHTVKAESIEEAAILGFFLDGVQPLLGAFGESRKIGNGVRGVLVVQAQQDFPPRGRHAGVQTIWKLACRHAEQRPSNGRDQEEEEKFSKENGHPESEAKWLDEVEIHIILGRLSRYRSCLQVTSFLSGGFAIEPGSARESFEVRGAGCYRSM